MTWSFWQRASVCYALAMAATALSALLRWLSPDVLGRAPYLGFYPAVVVAAILGGVGPGLLATFVSLLLVNFVFGQFNILNYGLQMRNVIWVLGSTGVSLLAGWVHSARRQTEADAAAARAAEAAAKESSERYRSLFENMLDGFAYCKMLFDDQGRPSDFVYLHVNRAFEMLTGLKGVVGRKVSEVIPGLNQSHPELFEIYGRVATTGQPEKFEIELEQLGICFSIAAYSTGKGYFTAVFDNVTARKQAEEELRQSEERLAAIVDSATDAIITVDEKQRIVMFNTAAENIFRSPASEAVGQPLDRFIPVQFRGRHRNHIEQFGEGGVTSRSMSCPGTLFGLRADGQEFPIEATISHVTVAGHTLYTVILRDITQRKQTETALLTSEKLATVGRLAATVAHEINNPLEAVTNLLFLAKQYPALDDAVRSHLDMAEAEVTRAAQIAKQALGFSKGGGATTKFRPAEVLDNVLLLCKPKLKNKEIDCERDFRSDVEVSGTESEVRQVFWNLLTNSIDAVPHGGLIKVRISASLHHVGVPGVRVTIGDNGHGIRADHLPRLFQPFFTTKHTGNGLGLWVTSEIVKKHGGSIRVRSRDEGAERTGTVFSVFFPAEVLR